MSQTLIITIPGFKKWQTATSKHRQWISLSCSFYEDPKIQWLQKTNIEATHVFIWILTKLDYETESLTIREDFLKAGLKTVLAKESNNFNPWKYLNLLSTSGLLAVNFASTSIQLDSNFASTTLVEQPQTQALIGSFTDKKDKTNKTKTPIVPKGDDSFFEKFWQAYPKKTGKKPCAGIWTRKKLDQHFDAIMQGLNAYKASEQWCRDSGKYIPNPSTFLNQERWNDETSSPLEDSRCSREDDIERWKKNRDIWFRFSYAVPVNREDLCKISYELTNQYTYPADETASPWIVVRKENPECFLDIRQWEPVNHLEGFNSAA